MCIRDRHCTVHVHLAVKTLTHSTSTWTCKKLLWHRLQENTEIRTRLSDFTDGVFEHNFLVLQYWLLTVSCVAIVVGSCWPFERSARMQYEYELCAKPFRSEFLSHHTVVWGILSLLCVCHFVCFFVQLPISQRRKKIGARNFFGMCVGLLSGHVLSHFGGQRSRSPGTKTCLALRSPTWLAYEWYALAASGCCGSADGRAHFLASEGWHRWRRAPRLVRRFAITHEARSVGSRNWGRRRRLRPYGGICVLQACWCTCLYFINTHAITLFIYVMLNSQPCIILSLDQLQRALLIAENPVTWRSS